MSYVRNAWYVAAWTDDLATDAPTAVKVLGEPIVLWTSDNRVVAFEDRCVHRLAPLSLGRCEAGGLRCMYHGLLFGSDGHVKEIPGQEKIPPQARVRTYPVVARHSWVWLWMGDPALADESLIPLAIGVDEPDWLLGKGALDYEAEARLINENLLDFSHLSFVHANSFGAGEEWTSTPMKITPLERGVRFERWIPDSKAPAFMPDTGLIDGYVSYDFLIPGVLLMWSGNFPQGTARACEFGRPDLSAATANVSFTSQAVTPVADRHARYFFSTGPFRPHGNEQLRDAMLEVTKMAFLEDKHIIEGQQAVLDRTPNPVLMPTIHDRGVTIYNRIVEKLVRSEHQASGAAPAGSKATA